MTQLELLQAAREHRFTGKFLYQVLFTPDCEKRFREYLGVEDTVDLVEMFGIFTRDFIDLKRPDDYQPIDFRPWYSDIDIPIGEKSIGDSEEGEHSKTAWINHLGVLEVPGSSYHFTRYISPLRNTDSLEDIEGFPIETFENFTDDHMKEAVDYKHSKGLIAVSSCGMMYEDAWQIRGYEQFLMDMIAAPENCESILDRICERNLRSTRASAKAGVDILYYGDDVANQRAMSFSVDIWRKLMKPRWGKVFAEAKRINPNVIIWYHSDGNIADIIPELIEIGVDILNPVQPECIDPIMVKKLYGDRIIIDGAIGTQTVMPFGTPEQVRETVKGMKEELGYDGAYIISPTHVLEPDVPPENIMAFLEECAK